MCRRNHRQLVPFGPLPHYGRSQMDDDGDERHPKQPKGGAAAAGEVGSEVFCPASRNLRKLANTRAKHELNSMLQH